GVPEGRVSVAVLLGLIEREYLVDVAVVHQQPRALVPRRHLARPSADVIEVARLDVDILQQSVAGVEASGPIPMGRVRQSGPGIELERRVLGRKIARSRRRLS